MRKTYTNITNYNNAFAFDVHKYAMHRLKNFIGRAHYDGVGRVGRPPDLLFSCYTIIIYCDVKSVIVFNYYTVAVENYVQHILCGI